MSNFSFGAPAPAANSSFGGFGTFGASANPPAQNANTSFGFGTPASQPSLGLQSGFGAAPVQAVAGTPSLGGFGVAKPATTSAFNFSTNTTGGFGTAPVTTAMVGAQPSTGLSFGGAAQPAQLGGMFSTPAAQPAQLGGMFGTPAAQPQLGGGLFGQKPLLSTSTVQALPTSGGLFGSTPLTTAPQQSLGLGGVDINSTLPKTTEGKNESAKVKETQVPQEIISTVDNLKDFIKKQKSFSSDIARTSSTKMNNVSVDIQNLHWKLSETANLVENNYTSVKHLRHETGQTIQHAEMAQRTHETPAGLQFENTAPLQYFIDLIKKYETDMISYKNQVELAEKHMHALANPQNFNADDLKKGLKQIHESFFALAGRLQETHLKVEAAKDQYLNLRKYLLRDKTNVFEEAENVTEDNSLSKVSSGPTPFSTLTSINLGTKIPNQNSSYIQNATNQTSGFGIANQTTNNSLLGSSFGYSDYSSSFNLQKPPIGTKRNKQ